MHDCGCCFGQSWPCIHLQMGIQQHCKAIEQNLKETRQKCSPNVYLCHLKMASLALQSLLKAGKPPSVKLGWEASNLQRNTASVSFIVHTMVCALLPAKKKNKYFELKTSGAAVPIQNTCSLWSLLCYKYIVAIATNLV